MRFVYCTLLYCAAYGFSVATYGTPLCPSSTLEPSLDYGRAFGGAALTMVEAPLQATDDESLVFEYFEYQTREPGYAPEFGVHVLRDATTGAGRLLLTRIKDSKPVKDEIKLNHVLVDSLLAYAAPIVSETRYPAKPCGEILYLDGFVIQAASGSPAYPERLQGGEAYTPLPNSTADHMVQLGRTLRKVILGTVNVTALAHMIRKD